jgi:hypothetical protein
MKAYRVNCYREGVLASFGVSEWHNTLASALDALLAHQQRSWSSVALVPQEHAPRRGRLRLLPRKEGQSHA